MKANLFTCAIFLLLFTAGSAQSQRVAIAKLLSSSLNDRITQSKFYYPKSVKRYYAQNGLQLQWIQKSHEKQTFAAMLLLDCVLHYGLSHADFHPGILSYDGLQEMLNTTDTINAARKVRFDLYMTDALITLINHLHYGKLNPSFSTPQRDGLEKTRDFDVLELLKTAVASTDFSMSVQSAQPKSKAYHDLQDYMRLIKGQYVGDCYEIPESDVRKVAINMERLRWFESSSNNVIGREQPYLTCIIKDGLPVFYPDKNNLDQSLEAAMYGIPKRVASKAKAREQLPTIQLKKN